MMAKAKSKYPTSFNTYKEFREIFDSIPEENCMEWAENLDPNLLRIKNKDGWTVVHLLARNEVLPEKFVTEELLRMKDNNGRTVAHLLAERGTLPEKFVTDELLRVKDNNGWTVAHDLAKSGTLPKKWMTDKLLRMEDGNGDTTAWYFYIFLSENSRWDLLTPMLLDVPYDNSNPLVITKLDKDLSGMSDSKLEEAMSVMSGETRAKLLSDIKEPSLFERIRKCLDREMESEAFETPPDGEQDLHSEEREELYCGMRNDR